MKIAYGFLAPTGRFRAGASDNVGSGYWTQTLSAGQTVYLSMDRATMLSALEMWEWHSTQRGTSIEPGQNADLDYSLMRRWTPRKDMRLQIGLVGYAQWQTTEKSGPNVSEEQATAFYRVYALGIGTQLQLPVRRASLGL